MDKSKNKLGNLLLNFCKGKSMFIVNGRVGNDKNIGRFTCRNASVYFSFRVISFPNSITIAIIIV
jgi:hypothetical protein